MSLQMSIRYNRAAATLRRKEEPDPRKSLALTGRRVRAELYRYAMAIAAVVIVVVIYLHLPVNPTTVALTFLLIVLGVASRWALQLQSL